MHTSTQGGESIQSEAVINRLWTHLYVQSYCVQQLHFFRRIQTLVQNKHFHILSLPWRERRVSNFVTVDVDFLVFPSKGILSTEHMSEFGTRENDLVHRANYTSRHHINVKSFPNFPSSFSSNSFLVWVPYFFSRQEKFYKCLEPNLSGKHAETKLVTRLTQSWRKWSIERRRGGRWRRIHSSWGGGEGE